MPIVNTSQARIELSADQADALAEMIMKIKEEDMPPMVYIEETNLPGVVVVGGIPSRRVLPTTLLHQNGALHQLGKIHGNQ